MTHFLHWIKDSSSQISMSKYQGERPFRNSSSRKRLYLFSEGFAATQCLQGHLGVVGEAEGMNLFLSV